MPIVEPTVGSVNDPDVFALLPVAPPARHNEQLIYSGRAAGGLVVPSLEPR
jgi:hypothetical protein